MRIISERVLSRLNVLRNGINGYLAPVIAGGVAKDECVPIDASTLQQWVEIIEDMREGDELPGPAPAKL